MDTGLFEGEAEPQQMKMVIVETLHNVKLPLDARCRRCKRDNDAAWLQFTAWLQYFAKVYGKVVVAVPPQYTSQNCHQCGQIVKKALSVRTHACGECGAVLDRDYNAALNVLAKGLKQYPAALENLNAWGENNLCLNLETGLSKLTR